MPESSLQWTTAEPRDDDGTVPYLPTVIATLSPDGARRRFIWGWARAVVCEMNRDEERYGTPGIFDVLERKPEYTTTVEWATPYNITETYPRAGDWTRGRELGQAARPEVSFLDPDQLTVGA